MAKAKQCQVAFYIPMITMVDSDDVFGGRRDAIWTGQYTTDLHAAESELKSMERYFKSISCLRIKKSFVDERKGYFKQK